ncbi:MAG: ABC transporter substrate-binding protein [Chloroflexi bacterium CG_4_9_14_3_um_filter_45_9]|nr:MAG: ABC transporter substrate-binding protein [Chloroflexi bacterium CG_4_9_14_3_um_filter_45_9]
MRKVKQTLFLGLVIVLVMGFALPGCAPKAAPAEKTTPPPPAVPIKIGIVLPMTGANAKFGEMERDSIMIAYNKFGVKEIGGRPINFIIEDERGDPSIAKSAVEKLVGVDNVDLIVGGYSSACTVTIAAAANDLAVPLIITTGSKDDITMAGYQWVFSGPRVPASHYADAMWDFLDKVFVPGGVKTVALYYEMTDWGTSSAKALRPKFEKRGIKLVYDSPYDSKATDFKPMLSKVKAANPDMIMAVSYLTDAGLLARQAAELRVNVKAYMGQAGGYTMPEFLELAGDNVNYIFTTTNWSPVVAWKGELAGVKWINKEYYDAYVATYKAEPDYHGSQAFAGWQVALDALLRANATGKPINRENIKEVLKGTKLMTTLGLIEHKEWTDEMGHHYYNQSLPPTYVIQWLKKAQQVVWPLAGKSGDYVFPVPKYEER